MSDSTYINECRMSLNEIYKLRALKLRVKKLSSRHKQQLERRIRSTCNRVAIVDGDNIFILFAATGSVEVEREQIKNGVYVRDRKIFDNDDALMPISLNQLPPSTLERLIFGFLEETARNNGIFKANGRLFFQPSPVSMSTQKAVEISLELENEFLKVYLNPTWIVFINALQSNRENLEGTPIINLCEHREACDLTNEHNECNLLRIGHSGYFSEAIEVDALNVEKPQSFSDCPRIDHATHLISVRPTQRARNATIYPSFTTLSRFADSDYSDIARAKFRKVTLMSSLKRWDQTVRWVNRIFFGRNESALEESQTVISSAGVQLSMDFVVRSSSGIYPTTKIPEQKIVVDEKNSVATYSGGGYQFRINGAYDRNSSTRPFEQIAPHLVLPNDRKLIAQTRTFIQSLSNNYSRKQYVKGDKDFDGINQPKGRDKYNVEFIDSWREENVTLIETFANQKYLEAVDDYIRSWNVDDFDPSKILVIVKPSEVNDDSPTSLYHQLKSRLNEAGIPSQFVTMETLDRLTNPREPFGPTLASIWQNIYAKMGGVPWRLQHEIKNVNCFIGIGFGIDRSEIGNHIYAGVAHVFDKYGNWIDVTSSTRQLTDSELDSFSSVDKYWQGTDSFKISSESTESIVYNALSLYQKKFDVMPVNIVLHKLGTVHECEMLGILRAVKRILGNVDNCKLGVLQIEQEHRRRIYGAIDNNDENLSRVVFRGIAMRLTHEKLLLATTGRNQRKYFGIGTPTPLLLTNIYPSVDLQAKFGIRVGQIYDVGILGQHVMALTQLHWGSTRDTCRLPITALYAQKVADFASKMDGKINEQFASRRPWFL